MPANVVKNAKQERLWEALKRRAGEKFEKGTNRYWRFVNGVFQKQKGKVDHGRHDDGQ